MECPYCSQEIEYCPSCGILVPADSTAIQGQKYCQRCGEPLFDARNVPEWLNPDQLELLQFPSPTEIPWKRASQSIYARILFESTLHEFQLSFLIDNDHCLIGRRDLQTGICPEIDLSECDEYGCVSRRHAQIIRQGNAFYIEDLGSVNGTFLYEGGKKQRLPVNIPYPLRHGSRIHIGNIIGVFSVSRDTRPLNEAITAPACESSVAKL